MYYGYYMLPDGTFCLAPPPPGIDASAYYNNVPSALMTPSTSSGALPDPTTTTTTPAPAEALAVAPTATAPLQVSSSTAAVTISETRYAAENILRHTDAIIMVSVEYQIVSAFVI